MTSETTLLSDPVFQLNAFLWALEDLPAMRSPSTDTNPITWEELHRDRGPTDIDDLVAVCPRHQKRLESNSLVVRRAGNG